MIIQMNATVCAAFDHGEDRMREIAGSDRQSWVQRPSKELLTRPKANASGSPEMMVLRSGLK
jgi:hypothetical protein